MPTPPPSLLNSNFGMGLPGHMLGSGILPPLLQTVPTQFAPGNAPQQPLMQLHQPPMGFPYMKPMHDPSKMRPDAPLDEQMGLGGMRFQPQPRNTFAQQPPQQMNLS